MELEIKERNENKLLGRLEIKGNVTFEGATPSNDVIKDVLAAELKADKGLIVVKYIHSQFSHREADFLACIYDSKEKMEKIEMSTKHLRKKAEEEKKKAAEAAAAEKKAEEKPVEEAPKEEKTEEPAEEPKEEGN